MIPNRWYPVLESAALRRKPVGLTRLGRRLVLWRSAAGEVACAPAACPHRGADLSQGRVVNGELVCPWHGFRFDRGGACSLMPCEGVEARVPRVMRFEALRVREGHGLVWLWHGDDRAELPPLTFFDDEVGDDLAMTAQASYILPHHYTRMVEANLDIHHTPFVHGRVFPTGSQLDPFEARIEGDRIFTSGRLVREGASKGFDFRADLLLPNLGYIELGSNLSLVVAATPVDGASSWMWFRYYQRYVRARPLRAIGKLIAWASVMLELKVVQPQDWRLFAGLEPGSVDEVSYHMVRADQGIALYRRRRSELLATNSSKPLQEVG